MGRSSGLCWRCFYFATAESLQQAQGEKLNHPGSGGSTCAATCMDADADATEADDDDEYGKCVAVSDA